MNSRPHLKQGDKLFLGNDDFTILGLIAEGGTSLIYDAERSYCVTADNSLLRLSKRVLIKEIAPFNVEFFRDAMGRITFVSGDTAAIQRMYHNEVASLALIQSRNTSSNRIPDMDTFGEFNNTYYIAMNHIKGEVLSAYIKGKRLKDGEIREIFQQILYIVRFLHHAAPNYCHLDIKPSNFIIDETGTIFMFDFGSSLIEENKWVNNFTEEYSAPEVVYNEMDRVDRRADIYSLGAVLYELVTGERPSLEKFLLCGDMYCAAEYCGAVDYNRLLKRMLTEVVEDRFASVDQLIEVISRPQ
jgi:serine/threonine protein kinase